MKPFKLDVLLFDMDGVLIDVSGSYRRTIQKTVHLYLEQCLGFSSSRRRLVTNEDISLLKSAGGFNNDWDLTSALIYYFLSISGIPPAPDKEGKARMDEIISNLRAPVSRFCLDTDRLFEKKDLPYFVKEVKFHGRGLRGVFQVLGNSWQGWLYRSGSLEKENVVKRIFQEVYLGEEFPSCYHLRPLFYRGPGLYLQEKLLIGREVLKALRKKIRMAIASGRPRFEADLALKRFHLARYFDAVVTLDECEGERDEVFRRTGKRTDFSKPHPYCLLRAIHEIGIPNPQCGYVGDVVDDMIAARAVGKSFPTIAIGFAGSQKTRKKMTESLLAAGADLVIHRPEELLQLI